MCNGDSTSKHYTVQRKADKNAMKCFSIPNNGSYNVHFPNIYYNAVEIIFERFCQQLKQSANRKGRVFRIEDRIYGK